MKAQGIKMEKHKITFIFCAGHCGSTLLNLILNGSPDVTAVSEIPKLITYLQSNELNNSTQETKDAWKSIAKCMDECGVKIDSINMNEAKYMDRSLKLSQDDKMEYSEYNYKLIKCIQKVTGSKVIVDASKNYPRIKYLYDSGLFNIDVIFLRREPRAIIHSYAKKYNGSFFRGLKRLVYEKIYVNKLKEIVDVHTFSYEDLAVSPEDSIKDLCEKLNIKYVDSMLDFRNGLYIGVGGNGMRFQKSKEIKIDVKWKKEMSIKNKILSSLFLRFL